ncbi:MAG: RNA polymerase factor sigma-32 [Pelagibacteraceae bacterium]|nr:RNA polymerase factor sigma-32 [Pelagibacteraceae bacterium]
MNNSSKILSKEEEYTLIKNWQNNKDKKSLNTIIRAYKRMPMSYAKKYSRYGVPFEDLVNEGVIAIMHALDKFDLKKNLRLSTYASWWIRAAMQEYVLKNWSIVRIASTAAQKSLFFGLNAMKNKILKNSNGFMSDKQVDFLAKSLKIKNKVVSEMESKLALGDQSLNQKYNDESENDFMSNLVDDSPNPEDIISAMRDNKTRSQWLHKALKSLDKREQEIVKRKLHNQVLTLENLSKKIGVSKERIRQIETKAYEKLSKKILNLSGQNKEFFIN